MMKSNLKSEIRNRLMDSFESLGLYQVDAVAYEAFSPDRGDILRYYSPYIAPRSSGFQIIGKIGIIAPTFERQWSCDNGTLATHAPLGMLIDNCKSLFSFPLFDRENLAEIPEWIAKIVNELEDLPEDREGLRKAIADGNLSAYPIHFFFLPNEKSERFLAWVS